MTDDELKKISFEEDLDLIARRFWSSGQCVDLATAKELVRPQLKAIRDKEDLENIEDDEMADAAFGRAGRRKTVHII